MEPFMLLNRRILQLFSCDLTFQWHEGEQMTEFSFVVEFILSWEKKKNLPVLTRALCSFGEEIQTLSMKIFPF